MSGQAEKNNQASRFVWYELHTASAKAASDFYTKFLPWTIVAESSMDNYSLINLGAEDHVGGVLEKPADPLFNGGHAAWIAYFGVANLATSINQVLEHGGKLHKEAEEIPHVGHFAVVADPQGAVFVLFEPAPGSAGSPLPVGTPGTVGWHELMAMEYKAELAFYTEIFGWQLSRAIPMGGDAVYQLFGINGVDEGGMMTRMDPNEPVSWRYYFNVKDAKAAAALVTQHGGKVTWGPEAVPTGQIVASCIDPQGAMFGVVAPAGS